MSTPTKMIAMTWLAEQQRQTAINLAPGDGGKGRASGIQNGAHCPLAVLFAQRCGDAHKVVTATHKQGRDCPCPAQKIV